MDEFIELAKLRKRIKIELEVMAAFFSTDQLKMMIINSENKVKIFKQQNEDIEHAVKELSLQNDLYNKLLKNEDEKTKNILSKYIEDFNLDLLCFKINASNFIYIIYFPFNNSDEKHNKESLELFKKQFEIMLSDIYTHKLTKDNLSQKNIENKTLKKEKYIASSALDSIPGNIAILNKEGNIVYTNSAWDKFAAANNDLPCNVGVGTNYLDVSKKAADQGNLLSAKAFNGIISVLNNNKDYFTMEYPCHSPQKQRWFRMYVSTFKGIGSYEVMILHQNITKEIIAEKKSETILNKLPGVIMKFDRNSDLVYFNKKAVEILDLDEENIGQKFDDLKVLNQENINYADKIKFVIDKKESINFKVKYNKDGKRYYYKNYLFPDFESNKLKSVTSIIPEVKSKDEIRKDNNKVTNYYLQLFNNFPDALVLLNIDEKIINANKSFCNLFGYEKKELKKNKLDNLIVPVGDEGDAQALTHMALTGEKINRNVIRINKNGDKIKLKLKAFPVLLHDNRIGVYAIYRELDKH